MNICTILKRALFAMLLLMAAQSAQAELSGSYTGSWYDRSFNGAGFVIEVLPRDRAVVYWFTYDHSGNQNWYIGVGTTTDTTIVVDELLLGSGGIFGDDFDADAIEYQTIGNVSFNFEDCNNGTVDFVVDGVASSQDLVRLTRTRDLDCETSDGVANESRLNQTGSWFNRDRSGEGFTVQALSNQRAVVNWFTYDPMGNRAWLIGVARTAEDYIYIEDMLISRNGFFGPEHDPDAVEFSHWGTVELRLGCQEGTAVYDSVDPLWGQGSRVVSRLTRIDELDCIEDVFGLPEEDQLEGLWLSDGFGWAAEITDTTITLMQHTAISCLEVATAPIAALETAGNELLINQAGNRSRFSGLDSVTPVEFLKVDSLPSVCDGNGTEFTADPNHNFDVFWQTFDELYAVFETRGLDWAAQRSTYEPMINSNTSHFELFSLFADMLTPLKDAHVSVVTPSFTFQANVGPERRALYNRSQSASVDSIIRNAYLGGQRFTTAEDVLRYGMLDGDTGYLEITRLNNFLNGSSFEEKQAFIDVETDKVLTYFANQGANDLVIDVRRNGGGNLKYGLQIAGRLTRGVSRQAFSERLPTTSGLTESIAITVAPTEGISFDGEVVLLTSPLTASAAESFTFAIRALPHATVVGGNTFGILSRTERTLPNGWTISITPGHVEAPNGERYEAVGIPPEIETDIFTTDDMNNNRDSALDQALAILNQ